jgi:hypothetical protein
MHVFFLALGVAQREPFWTIKLQIIPVPIFIFG